jgi:hypothetical protein
VAATADGAWPAGGARATGSRRRGKQGGAGFSPRKEALGEGTSGGDGAAEEIEAASELRAVVDLSRGGAHGARRGCGRLEGSAKRAAAGL